MTTREEVYDALDGERDYQKKWEASDSKGDHEIAAFVLFMEDYLQEVRRQISRGMEQDVRRAALATIRKVTALGVACMEQHGAPKR